jgi:hypothetical protein
VSHLPSETAILKLRSLEKPAGREIGYHLSFGAFNGTSRFRN